MSTPEPALGRANLDHVLGDYLASTRNAAEAALNSLNTSINWALTLALGVIAFVSQFIIPTTSGGDSQEQLLFVLGILAIALGLTVHFGIRTAKGYINVIRFAMLERASLTYVIDSGRAELDKRLAAYKDLPLLIHNYHILWKSPVSLHLICRKVLFEFGFVYTVLILSAAFIYIATNVHCEHLLWILAILVGLVVAIFFELLYFRRSAYGRYVAVDSLSEHLG